MMKLSPLIIGSALAVGSAVALSGCAASSHALAPGNGQAANASPFSPVSLENTGDSGAELQDERSQLAQLERVSTAVPWPRGLAWVDGSLVALARGRHRNSGGVDHNIQDQTGSLFRIDPEISEEVTIGQLASATVRENAELLAAPDEDIFYLPNKALDPLEDDLMDRPYCTLVYDETSQNLFICGYSGVDLPGKRFKKNATDSIHRFDLRTQRWYPVEMHNPSDPSSPNDPNNRRSSENNALNPTDSKVVSNEYYPHHDTTQESAPHGWMNGPDGACVAGDYLYAMAKDNHLVVQYDLAEIRENPGAGFPESRPVLGSSVKLYNPELDRTEDFETFGPSAAAVHDNYLYVGYRTSSAILRFRLNEDGNLSGEPAELIASFEPWSDDTGRSANLIDIVFNSRGELFVSCAMEGRIWNVGQPDPLQPFFGNDQAERPTTAPPYLDLEERTGQRAACGNILFDDQDRLYVCSGNYDTDSKKLAGVIYRAVSVN